MIIRNADVYTEDGRFLPRDIYIEGERFAALGEARNDTIVIDGSGCYAIPGLTDIHFHGCMGYDFCDGTWEAIAAMAEYEASVGVTGIVPATMTLGEDVLSGICRAAAEYYGATDKKRGAGFYGIHMEGPFISSARKGAQNEAYIRNPDLEMYDRLQKISGHLIRLVDIAPEMDGAMEFIESLQKRSEGTVISLAHTAADYDMAMKAFRRGASHVTHLYNAMNGYTHREPGLVGAAADYESAEVELICDGIHVHPAAVRTSFKMFGDDRIILVSDSMRATGMGNGEYELGGQMVKVTGNRAILEDGTIAGSVTNLMDCMRRAVLEMGIPLASAVKCAAVNPAKSVGIYGECGSITPGKLANLVLLKKDSLKTSHVILEGKPILFV
ncbi:MAG: N-acetylglucosamine-6-phosphate deacetylase [Acetatifactor sp.]|nr:N-acetylglucosamine-6-phosphate deacetylase [Acetatifactor sp.]